MTKRPREDKPEADVIGIEERLVQRALAGDVEACATWLARHCPEWREAVAAVHLELSR